MKRDIWAVAWRASLGHLVGLLAPIVVTLALPAIKWDEEPTKGQHDDFVAIRGDLPAWASWYATPDERLPGNLFEPGMTKAWLGHGRTWAAWVWLVMRNRAHAFAFRWAVPIGAPWLAEPGSYENTVLKVWWVRKPVLGGRLQFKMGYRSYWVNGIWYGVPCMTITRP